MNIWIISAQKYKNDKVYFCPEFHQLLKKLCPLKSLFLALLLTMHKK